MLRHGSNVFNQYGCSVEQSMNKVDELQVCGSSKKQVFLLSQRLG